MTVITQKVIDLGAYSHFHLLHGRHKKHVTLATNSGSSWKEKTYPFSTAVAMVLDLVSDWDTDTYLSQSGFNKEKRATRNVSALPALFVDLDIYKLPELVGSEPEEILSAILKRYPWLPSPTLLAFSGRGVYLVWCLKNHLGATKLPQWQAVEAAIVEMLSEFGADPAAKDAARVLRVAGSINQRSGERVWYRQVADPLPFADIEKAVHANAQPVKPFSEPKQYTRVKRHSPGGISRLYNGYTLSHARMNDLHTLAGLRGSLRDYRHRFLYCYSVFAAWYCPTPSALVRELSYFAEEHFADPQRYQGEKRCKTVLERMAKGMKGLKMVWRGKEIDPRYRMQNRTIINLLDITEDEQRSLQSIICTDEKVRRLTEKRRAKGVKLREQYLAERQAQAQERRQLVLDLASQGLNKTAIAEQVGMDVRHVRRVTNQSK